MKNSEEAIQLRAILNEHPNMMDNIKVTPRVEDEMRKRLVVFHDYLSQIGECIDLTPIETLGLLMKVCPSIAALLNETQEPDDTTESRMMCAFMKAAVSALLITCVEKDLGGVN
jgi:hypothetical protein